MQQQAETDILTRAARDEIERRERELDARVSTETAPEYLRTEARQAGGRRRGRARVVNIVYDESGAIEDDATTTFGVAGIFYMLGSEATRYEGQPVVVVDADQALRHGRHAHEMRAVRHIYRGSRQAREDAIARLRQYSTPVSVSNYPVL
jgi:hypothetical protein